MNEALIINIIKYSIAIVCALIIVFILLQNQQGGLGSVFGGQSSGEAYRSKRGIEAILYNGTIILTILLVVLSLSLAFINA